MLSRLQPSEMNIFANKNFDLPLSLLPKLKYNKHQQFNPACTELVSVLAEFNYFKDSIILKKQELLEVAALRVGFKTYKAGEFLDDSLSNNVHFILKGDIGLFEERNEREIKQEHYWRQQMEKVKRKMEQTNYQNEKQKLEEEFMKAEKVFNFYYKEDQAFLLAKDVERHQYNFNLNNQCLYKQTQIIKSGICIGYQTDHSERNLTLGKYQFVALTTSLILTLDEEAYLDIFKKNEGLQNKLQSILSKYFANIFQEKEGLQKVIKTITELSFNKNQLIYHENFDTSQNIYILTEGYVEITAKRLKQQILVDNIGPDEIFGCEFFACSRSLRSYTARSQINATKVLVISYEALKQHFSNTILNEFQEYATTINNKYQSILTSHISHIVSICKTKGLKVPANYQNTINSNNTSTTTNDTQNCIQSAFKSLSPQKRSSVSKLSKKHSQIIEESLQNLKRQTSAHRNSLSGYQTASTNTSSLQNSVIENKIQALYNQISHKSGSSTQIIMKGRQNSIEIDMLDTIPRVQFQTSNPTILGEEQPNDKVNTFYPKSLSLLPTLPSPKSTSSKFKLAENSQQQNQTQTQNQMLKRYLSSRYSRQYVGDILPGQNFEEEIKRVEPIFRKSQTITKDQLHSYFVNVQNQQFMQETSLKPTEEYSPIKKKRNLSVRDVNSLEQTPNIMNQKRILRQFRVSEEVEKYINQNSNQKSVSCQQSPIKRMKNNELLKTPKNTSLDKYKNINNRQNKSITSILSTSTSKKQDNSPFTSDNYFIPANQFVNNYCKSLTNI